MAEPAPFRLLFVCTGNLCRSPLAERLAHARLEPDLFTVDSAGTEAVLGAPMDPDAAEIARDLGASTDGHRARQLTPAAVEATDLVLTATREHRAAVVQLVPEAARYTFTMAEFARLTAAIPATGLAGLGAVERARALVAIAGKLRGTVRPDNPDDDDIPDPYRRSVDIHRRVGAVIAAVLAVPIGLIRGESTAGELGHRIAPHGFESDVDTDATGDPEVPSVPVRTGRAGRPRWRAGRRVGIAALLLVLAPAGWLAVRGWQARGDLVAARSELGQVRAAVLAGNPVQARLALGAAQDRAARARRLTGDPVWRLAASVPYLGDPVDAVRALAGTADDLAARGLPGLVDAGARLAPAKLRPGGDEIAVGAFTAARPTIDAATRAVAAAQQRVADASSGWLPGPLGAAMAAARSELAQAASTLDGADRAARLVPALLGTGGTRRYLLVFQNNAESRGTGGLPGMYAVLAADHGRIRVERLGSNTDLLSAKELPVDLGLGFSDQWGDDPALWPNSNEDPRFPAAARIWLALWQRQTGQRLDGAIATDPVAVSYLLAATGPVPLPDGEALTAASVVRLTMSEVYARYPVGAPQDAYLRRVAAAAIGTFIGGRGDPRALLDGLSRAARERRLVVYSTRPGEESDLDAAGLAGTLPTGAGPGGTGPYAYVVLNNGAGSKMDYYLDRTVSYVEGRCVGATRHSELTIRLGNSAPAAAALPRYVTQRADLGNEPPDSARGVAVEQVWVYGSVGAGVTHSTVDGHALQISALVVEGRPVWGFKLAVPPGGARTVHLQLTEPVSAAAPVITVQPLVRPMVVRTTAGDCG
jgi:protein-tyrosine-phosphatase